MIAGPTYTASAADGSIDLASRLASGGDSAIRRRFASPLVQTDSRPLHFPRTRDAVASALRGPCSSSWARGCGKPIPVPPLRPKHRKPR